MAGLKEYFEEQQKRGYSFEQVKNFLLQQGYTIEQINQDLADAKNSTEKSYNGKSNKGISFFLVIAILIFIFGLASIIVVYTGIINKEPDKILLDFNTEPSVFEVQPGQSVTFKESFGIADLKKKVKVNINHKLVSIGNGEIVASESEISDSGTKDAKVIVPRDAEPGYYMLQSNANYRDTDATAAFLVKVFKKEVKPTCFDNVENQGEEGIDCDGPCTSCTECDNGDQDGDETGIDCGGSCGKCIEPSCTDGMLNQDEEEVDCGGICLPCPEPSCNDAILNQDEEEIDCGGVCSPCSEKPKTFEDMELHEKLLLVREEAQKDAEKGIVLCNKIGELRDREECYTRVADVSNNIKYCEIISAASKKDSCYMSFALKGDYSVCEKISNIYLKNSCLSLERAALMKKIGNDGG